MVVVGIAYIGESLGEANFNACPFNVEKPSCVLVAVKVIAALSAGVDAKASFNVNVTSPLTIVDTPFIIFVSANPAIVNCSPTNG